MLRRRYILSDVREDIKIANVVPIESIYYAGGFLLAATALYLLFLKEHPILGICMIILPPIAIIIMFTLAIPSRLIRNIDIAMSKNRIKTLEDISSIQSFGAISETRKRKMIYLENKIYPWEFCPDNEKDVKADAFAQQVLNTVRSGVYFSVYGICAPEDTRILEERSNKAMELPPQLRMIENRRIEHHYNLSKSAFETKYYSRISIPLHSDEELVSLSNNFPDCEPVGGDIVEELLATHLCIGSSMKRGKLDVGDLEDEEDAPAGNDDSVLQHLIRLRKMFIKKKSSGKPDELPDENGGVTKKVVRGKR